MAFETMQPAPRDLSPSGLLGRNLAALDRVDPPLAERLRLPVDDSRVTIAAGGAVLYRLHRERIRLDVPDPAARVRGLALGEGPAGVPLLLGVGSGELLPELLAVVPRVVAWDADPWHLRLTLSRHDLAVALVSGRLRLALGTDLLDLAGPGWIEVAHPVLAALHTHECELRRRPRPGPRAMVAAGGLFVDEVRSALARRGWSTWGVDLTSLAREELVHQVRRFRPECLFAVNYTEGLAEFCEELGITPVCWEVDPALGPPRATTSRTARVFTYRRANERAFLAAGFERVHTLPLAADPELRRPLELSPEERERLGAPVAFVGSSMRANARTLLGRACALWAAHLGGGPEALGEARAGLERVLAAQRREASFRVPELLEAEVPGLAAMLAARGQDLAVLVGEQAAADKRARVIAGLGSIGISVWGDEGWSALDVRGVRWRGRAGHRQELTRIYNAVRVHVDVGRLYQNDIVPMRVFDILACGGFLVAERTAALEDAFEVGRELEAWSTPEELRDKVAHYLEHPAEAAAIGARGREAVLARHTIDQRLDVMLAGLG